MQILYRQKGTGRGKGRESEESSDAENTFCLPQTADTIFKLIRFQDTTRLRAFLVSSPLLSSVSRGVNRELVVSLLLPRAY